MCEQLKSEQLKRKRRQGALPANGWGSLFPDSAHLHVGRDNRGTRSWGEVRTLVRGQAASVSQQREGVESPSS